MFHRCAMFLGVMLVLFSVAFARADVFNMGGTRDPIAGTWTGAASLEFVTVRDPGNAADTAAGSGSYGFGSVNHVYRMGKYSVTMGQYCQFLNAVAKSDSYGLYKISLATQNSAVKITRSGVSGGYAYSVAAESDRGGVG